MNTSQHQRQKPVAISLFSKTPTPANAWLPSGQAIIAEWKLLGCTTTVPQSEIHKQPTLSSRQPRHLYTLHPASTLARPIILVNPSSSLSPYTLTPLHKSPRLYIPTTDRLTALYIIAKPLIPRNMTYHISFPTLKFGPTVHVRRAITILLSFTKVITISIIPVLQTLNQLFPFFSKRQRLRLGSFQAKVTRRSRKQLH